MSITKPLDGWDRHAAQLLRRRVMDGSPHGVNYAPDTRYDADKRCNVTGPLTVQIDEILRRHASLWAQQMRELGDPPAHEAKAAWLAHMREADAEIKRFVAGHTVGHGAAA
jgi:hypothetical protein